MTSLAGARLFVSKVARVLARKVDALSGRVFPLAPTLEAMARRPFELHLELTNLCNANCVFCPYQYQERQTEFMPLELVDKVLQDYVRCGGGSVGLTPIVGDALIHRQFVEIVRKLRSEPAIDRIWLTTNAIVLDQHGIQNVLESGLTSITISTSGFDAASYARIYRSSAYKRMHRNVVDLVRTNKALGDPVEITIGLRTDRPLDEVMRDEDFREILQYEPAIDFTWSFTSAGGRITQDQLPTGMRLRVVDTRREPCVQLFNGPIVLPSGTVMACSCVAAVDAVNDLGIGNVRDEDLVTIFASDRMQAIRKSFGSESLNGTCSRCDMYRDLELYRTREGRERARISKARASGEVVHRERPKGAFAGG